MGNLGFKDYVGWDIGQLDNGITGEPTWEFTVSTQYAQVYLWPPHTVSQHQSTLHSYGEWSNFKLRSQ